MQRTIVEQPTKSDILFGRHAQSRNHEGNKRFREIVSKYQDAYHSPAIGRMARVAIVAKIVNEVHENGARFLKFDSRLDKWYEVDRKACIDKVGHSIRDKQVIVHRKRTHCEKQVLGSRRKEKSAGRKNCQEATCSNQDICPAGGGYPTEPSSRSSLVVLDETSLCRLLSVQNESAAAGVTETAIWCSARLLKPSSLLSKQVPIVSPCPVGEATARLLAYSQCRQKADHAAASPKLLFAEEICAAVQEQNRLQRELAFLRLQRTNLLPTIAKPSCHPYLSESASILSGRRSLLGDGKEVLESKLAAALYLAGLEF